MDSNPVLRSININLKFWYSFVLLGERKDMFSGLIILMKKVEYHRIK